MPAVSQHRDRVGYQIELLKPMGDEDNRRSLVAQTAYDPEQFLDFRRGKGRSRLVEDQKAEVGGERTSDLDELQFRNRKLGNESMRVDVDPNPRQRMACPSGDSLAVDRPEGRDRRRAHAYVFCNVEMGKKLGS